MKFVRIKWPILALIIFVVVLAFYLFWPLGSIQFAVHYDKRAIAEKKEFLSQIVEYDSVSRPNIVLITVDGLGVADCSLYGEGNILMPNIDHLGAEGIIFKNNFKLLHRFVQLHARR